MLPYDSDAVLNHIGDIDGQAERRVGTFEKVTAHQSQDLFYKDTFSWGSMGNWASMFLSFAPFCLGFCKVSSKTQ